MFRKGNRDTRGKGTFVWLILAPQSPNHSEGEDGVTAGRARSDQEDSCGVGRVGASGAGEKGVRSLSWAGRELTPSTLLPRQQLQLRSFPHRKP